LAIQWCAAADRECDPCHLRRWHRVDRAAGHEEDGMPPECVEQRLELLQQLDRIEGLGQGGEPRLRVRREQIPREESPIGRLRRVVVSPHTAAVAALLPELHRRREEVDREAHRLVHLGELMIRRLALEAVVADELSHDHAILLLDARR
jgi:hypothetical protein